MQYLNSANSVTNWVWINFKSTRGPVLVFGSSYQVPFWVPIFDPTANWRQEKPTTSAQGSISAPESKSARSGGASGVSFAHVRKRLGMCQNVFKESNREQTPCGGISAVFPAI